MKKEEIIKKAEFYKKCIENNWEDMDDSTQSLKAKVLAKDMGLNYKNIKLLFAEGEKALQTINKEEEERQKKERLERERLAVNGELIASFIDSENPEESAVLNVYRRPDKSFYYVYGKERKKYEGVPSLLLDGMTYDKTEHHASQAIYTSATVGGITTGGIDYTPEKTVVKTIKSPRSKVHLISDRSRFIVKWIRIHRYAAERFIDNELYNAVGGELIKCFDMSEEEIKEARLGIALMIRKQGLSMDKATDMYSSIRTQEGIYSDKAQKIIDLMKAIFSKEYPKSADEMFEDVYPLLSSLKKEDIDKGIEECSKINNRLSTDNKTRFNNVAVNLINQLAKNGDEQSISTINQLIILINDSSFVMNQCHDSITELLNRLVAKDNSKDISKALELADHFRKVPEIQEKYDEAKTKLVDVIQREKEESILLEELQSKKRKRTGIIFGVVLAIITVIAGIVFGVVMPRQHVGEGGENIASNQNDDAITEQETEKTTREVTIDDVVVYVPKEWEERETTRDSELKTIVYYMDGHPDEPPHDNAVEICIATHNSDLYTYEQAKEYVELFKDSYFGKSAGYQQISSEYLEYSGIPGYHSIFKMADGSYSVDNYCFMDGTKKVVQVSYYKTKSSKDDYTKEFLDIVMSMKIPELGLQHK